jgi:hypothetical protein
LKWALSSFKDVNLGHGYSTEQTVVINSVNSEIDGSVFDIAVPRGAMVTDRTNNNEVYLDLGETKRPIRLGEYNGENYDDLLKSARSGSGIPSRSWLLVGAAAITIAMVVALIAIRRFKTR